MRIFLWIKAWIRQWIEWDRMRKLRKKSRDLSIFLALTRGISPAPPGPYRQHPNHDAMVSRAHQNLSRVSAIGTLAYGDSLLDIPRDDITAVSSGFNFALSGSWSHHMAQMARDLQGMTTGCSISNVIVGCLGGNPLLAYQPIDTVIREAQKALDTIREVHPRSRIIVYGIPPVARMYVLKHAPAVDQALLYWVLNDRDAVFLPLQREFSGSLGLTPKASISSDGVHFSPVGVRLFDDLLMAAKMAPRGSIVD